MMINQMIIEKAQFGDLEEILAIQKLAFQSEAEAFKDYSIDPLIQSLESIKDDFKRNLYLKAKADCKIVGSVRAYEKENVCYIGRLFVHPDFQNKGIGRSLMLRIEELNKHCTTYSLFVAKRVSENLQFYCNLGYNKVREEKINENLTFVYFVKNSRAGGLTV